MIIVSLYHGYFDELYHSKLKTLKPNNLFHPKNWGHHLVYVLFLQIFPDDPKFLSETDS